MRPPIRERQRGFALLLVFLMAAVVALFLYTQLPRVAFESERDKEQTVIDRGEQYKRAIQLYVLAQKKYPQRIEDLENTNDKRYLRKRYIDPLTGKDEWRLIHVNAAGILTDSLVQKPPTADGKTPTGGPLSSSSTTPDPNTPVDPNDVNSAVRRRPSDVVGNAYTQPANSDPNDPRTWAPITMGAQNGLPNGQPSGAVGFNGGLQGAPPQQFNGQGLPGAVNQNQGFALPGQQGFNPAQNQFKIDANGQLVPIAPTQPGQVINSQTGGVANTAIQGGLQGAPGISQGNSIASQNAATTAINNLLTNPNPQAGAGLGNSAGTTAGGIAGVASNYKGPSIKIYGGRQKYEEWEVIFSQNKQKGVPNTQKNPLQPGQNGLNPPQNGSGTNPPGSTTGNP